MNGNEGFEGMGDMNQTGAPQVGAQPQHAGTQVAPAGNTSLSISDSAVKALSELGGGVAVGEIGMKVSRVPIEKYKASTQKVDRIAFITKSVIAVKTHYIENVGNILCFGKKCCEIAGMPAVRYLFPVVVYQTDNEGTIVGKKLDIRILSAGEDLYKSIITINRATAATGGIDSVDCLVVCTDDKYQKITLNQAGPAAWKKSPTAVQFVAEKWEGDAEYAYMAVARKVDEAALNTLLGIDGGNVGQTFGGADNNADLGKFFDE